MSVKGFLTKESKWITLNVLIDSIFHTEHAQVNSGEESFLLTGRNLQQNRS